MTPRRPSSSQSGTRRVAGGARPRQVPAERAASAVGSGSGSSGSRQRGLPTAVPERTLPPRVVILAVVCLLAFVVIFTSLRAYLSQQAQYDAVVDRIKEASDTSTTLENELAQWKDDTYVRSQVRERLGYVMPGDTSYGQRRGHPGIPGCPLVREAPGLLAGRRPDQRHRAGRNEGRGGRQDPQPRPEGAADRGAQPGAVGSAQDHAETGRHPADEGDPVSPTPQTQEPVSSADLEALAEQLGRVPRGVVAIAARCVCGRPTVVRTAPRLDDGTPFPTSYYLTHPAAVKGCSTLEAEHLMETFNADLADDAELAAAYVAAHDDYLARRAELGQVPEIEGVSAGGMPTRVKCLHALLGHSLAAGAGVNPIGDRTLEALRERGLWDPERCSC